MMPNTDLPKCPSSHRRRGRRRGSEIIEFCFVMMPLFAMIFVELDITWGIFCKATLEQAVRVGARYGITNAIPDPNRPDLCASSATLTDCITQHVQWAAGAAAGTLQGGLLGGTTGASYVNVAYYVPGTTTPITLPNTTANNGGNVIVVSIVNYPISTLVGPFIAPNSSSLATVASADTMTQVVSTLQPAP